MPAPFSCCSLLPWCILLYGFFFLASPCLCLQFLLHLNWAPHLDPPVLCLSIFILSLPHPFLCSSHSCSISLSMLCIHGCVWDVHTKILQYINSKMVYSLFCVFYSFNWSSLFCCFLPFPISAPSPPAYCVFMTVCWVSIQYHSNTAYIFFFPCKYSCGAGGGHSCWIQAKTIYMICLRCWKFCFNIS